MSNVINVDSLDELRTLVATYRVVVVDFSADSWCVPCQRLSPHYAAASENLDEDVALLKVDIDEHPEFVEAFQIMGVPTLLAYRDGEFLGDVRARTAVQLVNEISSF